MTASVSRVALVVMHTPPHQQAGTGDSGGLNVSLLGTAHELAARGVEVEILSRAEGPASVTIVEPGVSIHSLPVGPPEPVAKTSLVGLTDEFGEAVAKLTGRGAPRYDIIHAHYWLSGIATLPVALELGVPLVQSFHTLAAMKNRHRSEGQALEPEQRSRSEAYLAGEASAVVAGSSAEVGCLIDDLRAPAERLWVIPPGVDVELFRPGRPNADRMLRHFDIGEGRPVLAVVGRIQPLKDQELAIRALAALRERSPAALQPVLVVAGEPTPGDEGYVRGLRELAGQLGLGDDVRFVGALDRDTLADLLAAATLTLFPSHSETFGLVALESAASGTPVIGYRSTGLAESIADGRSGLLLDSRQPADWAEAIDRLLRDEQSRDRLARSAREHALDFTWGANATALLGLYGGLAEARRR